MIKYKNYFYEKFPHKQFLIMGILNVTPDSFAEVEHCDTTEKAVAHGLCLMNDGADIVDVGGESTRPGADETPIEEELSRILPVLQQLIPQAKKNGILLSIDTRKALVMQQAIQLGVDIINDVSALQYDKHSLAIVAKHNTPVILSHTRGIPKNMKTLTVYRDLIPELQDFLYRRCQICHQQGITNIAIDPGLGFAKTADQNITILRSLKEIQKLGYPICIGWSRKRSIDRWFSSNTQHPEHRDLGSIVGGLWCLQHNVRIFRVHNVKDTRHSFDFWQALNQK